MHLVRLAGHSRSRNSAQRITVHDMGAGFRDASAAEMYACRARQFPPRARALEPACFSRPSSLLSEPGTQHFMLRFSGRVHRERTRAVMLFGMGVTRRK